MMDEKIIERLMQAAQPQAMTAVRATRDPIAAAIDLLIAEGYRIIPPGAHNVDETPGASIAEENSSRDNNPVVREVPPPIRPLSSREFEVLSLLAEGAPNKVIARRLDISVHTAKFHVASIIAKMDAANRTDAIATAMREGLVLV